MPLHLQTTRWAQTPRTDLQTKKRHRDSATASPPVLGDGLIRGSLTMLLLSASGSRILLVSSLCSSFFPLLLFFVHYVFLGVVYIYIYIYLIAFDLMFLTWLIFFNI